MSLYKNYLECSTESHMVEDDNWFFVYRVIGNDFHIRDLYIEPQARTQQIRDYIWNLIQEVAKVWECDKMRGKVYNTNPRNETLKRFYCRKYNFKHDKENDTNYYIALSLDLNGE